MKLIPIKAILLASIFLLQGCDGESDPLIPETLTGDTIQIPDPVEPEAATPSRESVEHTHGDRSHTHPLPVQGVAHKHGAGPVGR